MEAKCCFPVCRGYPLFPGLVPHRSLVGMRKRPSPCLRSLPILFILFPTRFKSMQSKLATRRQQLQASVELYEFNLLSNLELTWVAEHMSCAGPISPAQCWHDAQSLQRKHKVAPSASCQAPNISFPVL